MLNVNSKFLLEYFQYFQSMYIIGFNYDIWQLSGGFTVIKTQLFPLFFFGFFF